MTSTKYADHAEQCLQALRDCLALTLHEVLRTFEPDAHMKEELAKYLPKYGDRPVLEFLEEIVAHDPSEPDIWNGEMKPFNVLLVLDALLNHHDSG